MKDAVEYGKDTLTFEIVINSLKYNELDLKMKDKCSIEGLYVRGRPTTKNNHKKQRQVLIQWHNRDKTCFYRLKGGHLIKDCHKRIREEKNRSRDTDMESGEVAIVVKCDIGEVLVVSM